MGSSPSKLKIQKLILESLKKEFDSNNAKIDEIINEEDEFKKEELIEKLKIDEYSVIICTFV